MLQHFLYTDGKEVVVWTLVTAELSSPAGLKPTAASFSCLPFFQTIFSRKFLPPCIVIVCNRKRENASRIFFAILFLLNQKAPSYRGFYFYRLPIMDARNACVRSLRGAVKICSGAPSSSTTPSTINKTWSATERAKAISCVTRIIVSFSSASR